MGQHVCRHARTVKVDSYACNPCQIMQWVCGEWAEKERQWKLSKTRTKILALRLLVYFYIFFICTHVHVLRRTLVLLGVTWLKTGFDLIWSEGRPRKGGGVTAIYGLYKAVCVFNKFRKTLWKVDQNENAYISYQRSRSKTHHNEKDDRKYHRPVCLWHAHRV